MLLLLLAAAPLGACGGTQGGDDVPPSLRQSDRLLGKAMAAMDRDPAAPESMLVMPADVQAAVAQTGFADVRVRAYARAHAAAQRTFDAKWKPLLARAHESSERAGRILAHAMADRHVSPQFLLRYRDLALAMKAWIAAERRTANDATRMTAAFGRATAGRNPRAQHVFYAAFARARRSRDHTRAAADRADRASAALSALLNVNRNAAAVAAALIDADASGLLARKWHPA
jgi:hypothetical protein